MDFNKIIRKIKQAIEKISDTSGYIWRTTEWNICHHIACGLSKEFVGLNVDVELRKEDLRRPDIVIHKRGNNEDNLVVFQVKKNPTTSKIKEDIEKIKETFFKDPYNYSYGIFVSVGELPKRLPDFDKNKIIIMQIYKGKIIIK